MFRQYSMLLVMAMFAIAGAGGSVWAQTEEEMLATHAALVEAFNAHDVDLFMCPHHLL